VQNQILAEQPSARLRVYAVWLPMLWTDNRRWWNGTNMPDRRVTHYWDGDRKVGQWFASQVDGYEGVSWDSYYLYGPAATWDAVPSPLAGSGGTIHAEGNTLEAQIRALLGPGA
jgi:hypothetical protein